MTKQVNKLEQVHSGVCTAFVNKALLHIGIVNAGLPFWPSHIANLLASIELCRCLAPKPELLVLRVCYREVYDELIELCGFEHPVLDLLKLCFGNAYALKVTLVMLMARCRAPNKKRLCYPNISSYSRILDLYDAVNASLDGSNLKSKPLALVQLLVLSKINLISVNKLNLLRKLLSLDIGLYRGLRLFHNHMKMRKSFILLKRLKDNLDVVGNLKVFHLLWFYSFVSDVRAIYQLSLVGTDCIAVEVSHSSNGYNV